MIPLKFLYFGIVEGLLDPLQMGRLRVRVFGVHTEDKQALPSEKLPWCDVMQEVTNPFISGIGWSPTGMVQGQMVVLIPKDPEFLQEWLVLGSVGGFRAKYKNGKVGFNDPDGLYPLDGIKHDVNVLARGPEEITLETDADLAQPGDGSIKPGLGATADKYANRTVENVDYDQKPREEKAPEEEKYPNPDWMPIANQYVGVNEKDNPATIKEFHSKGGGSSSWGGETPWCASFVGFSLKGAGVSGSGSALARSYVNWGKSVSVDSIPYGAIVVVKGSRGPSSGHVFFCVQDLGDSIKGLGGNQSSKSFDNGGEVSISTFKKSNIVAVRWPK